MVQDGNSPGEPFVETLQGRAEEKRTEYLQLLHEQKRVALHLERIKAYIQALNSLLEAEGQSKVQLREPSNTNGVGKPGNRSKDMPLRKPEWEGMGLSDIVETILGETNDDLHADGIVDHIYEAESETDKRKAKRSLVSTLRIGAKDGRWAALGQNRYQGKPKRHLASLTS